MPPARKVIVFGTSLLLSLVADQLSERPDFAVTRASPLAFEALERLRLDRPDVLIVEQPLTTDERPDRILMQIMEAYPEVPVIRLDSTAGRATILHSRQIEVEKLTDLAHVIENLTAERANRGG